MRHTWPPVSHTVSSLSVLTGCTVSGVGLGLGLALAAAIGVLAGAPAAWALASRRSGLFPSAILLIGAGGSLAWIVTLSWDPGWELLVPKGILLGGLIGLPASIASLLLIAALLDLCDRAV